MENHYALFPKIVMPLWIWFQSWVSEGKTDNEADINDGMISGLYSFN